MGRWRMLASRLLGRADFGVLIVPAGLVAASVAVITVGALAGSESRIGEVLALAALLSAAAVALFVFALGLPLSPWPA